MPLVAKTLRMGFRNGGKRPNLSESRLRHQFNMLIHNTMLQQERVSP